MNIRRCDEQHYNTTHWDAVKRLLATPGAEGDLIQLLRGINGVVVARRRG